jgi:dTDP-4-dehydrorhamnose reductase
MLRLGQEKEELKIIDDQYGAPTGADLIADITAHALSQTLRNPSLEGLYHLTAAGETTWYHYACFVLEFARKNGVLLTVPRDAIHAVSSSTFVTAAQRPMNSRLNCQKLVHAFNLALPQWEKGVARMLTEILEQK